MLNCSNIWHRITGGSELRKRVIVSLFIIGIIGVPIIVGNTLFIAMLFALCILATLEYFSIIKKPQFSSIALIVLVFSCVYYLRFSSGGLQKIIILSLTIAFFDTFAYFVGKAIGKRKLAPSISPNKTIEGFVGGIILTTALLMPLHYLFACRLPFIYYVILVAILCILSQIGDLIESKFKRKHNVKDSGTIIPGHGGILDRFDGYIVAAPFFAITNFICSLFNIQIF